MITAAISPANTRWRKSIILDSFGLRASSQSPPNSAGTFSIQNYQDISYDRLLKTWTGTNVLILVLCLH